jgi:GTP-binding protein
MYNWIAENGFDPIIIATKLDKINRSQINKNIKIIKDRLKVREGTVVIPFSAQTKQGREEIYETIDKILEDNG